jgi:hypothetical protein
MSALSQGPIFVLRLRSLRGDDVRRLRALLKVLLRRYGWRCVSLEQEMTPRPVLRLNLEAESPLRERRRTCSALTPAAGTSPSARRAPCRTAARYRSTRPGNRAPAGLLLPAPRRACSACGTWRGTSLRGLPAALRATPMLPRASMAPAIEAQAAVPQR